MPRFEADSSARCDVGVFRAPDAKRHFCTKKNPQVFQMRGVFVPFPSHTKTQAIASQKCNECISARAGDGQNLQVFADRKDMISDMIGLVARIEANIPKNPKNVHDSMMASGLTPIHLIPFVDLLSARQDGHSSRRPVFPGSTRNK